MSSGEVIKQGRAESQGGRKPDLYRLAENAFYVLSVDLSKFNMHLALYSCNHELAFEKENHKITLNNEKETFDQICSLIDSYLEKKPKSPRIRSLRSDSPCPVCSIRSEA